MWECVCACASVCLSVCLSIYQAINESILCIYKTERSTIDKAWSTSNRQSSQCWCWRWRSWKLEKMQSQTSVCFRASAATAKLKQLLCNKLRLLLLCLFVCITHAATSFFLFFFCFFKLAKFSSIIEKFQHEVNLSKCFFFFFFDYIKFCEI